MSLRSKPLESVASSRISSAPNSSSSPRKSGSLLMAWQRIMAQRSKISGPLLIEALFDRRL
jgi:hypothetical protein